MGVIPTRLIRLASPHSPGRAKGDPPGRCEALQRLSEDHRDMVAAACGRCQGHGGPCLVEEMQRIVHNNDGDPPPHH